MYDPVIETNLYHFIVLQKKDILTL